jgi:hypothetical protein
MFSCTFIDQGDFSRYPNFVCCQPKLQIAALLINRDLYRRGFDAGVGASLASLGLFRRRVRKRLLPALSRLSYWAIFCFSTESPKPCVEGFASLSKAIVLS